jgi:hypothetical protein
MVGYPTYIECDTLGNGDVFGALYRQAWKPGASHSRGGLARCPLGIPGFGCTLGTHGGTY